jgi:hypothetical protein
MKKNLYKHTRRNFLKTITLSIPALSSLTFFPFSSSGENYEKESARISSRNQSNKHNGTLQFDLVVYGATSAGVMAAYTARMYGLSVLLVEPGRHLGGLTSGGLGRTDTGDHLNAITGLSREFYLRLGHYYGMNQEAWTFEPHVAEQVFKRYVDEANLEVMFSRRVKYAEVINGSIKSVVLEYAGKGIENNLKVAANYFIDATYEGELMARAGVSYTIGREGNSVYNETYNGVVPSKRLGSYGNTQRKREWPNVDPYIKPGKPDSGLLPEINGIGHAQPGTGDKKVQAYCYRMCLTQDRNNQMPITEPEGYDPSRYELLVRLMNVEPWDSLQHGFNIATMPNGKTDWNNDGMVGFSTDYIGKNYNFPDADYDEREKIWNEHKKYQQGLIYFIAHDERIPSDIRKVMQTWGYCRDEFLDTDGWPHALYIRESRRMVSDFVMTEHHCIGNEPVKDGIAMGAYALDSHNCQRIVVNGHVENEGNFFVGGFDPYPISYKSIVPKQAEIDNLWVPVCLSASHVAFGSIRMEPVYMGLGHATGVAARFAAEKGKKVQDVNPKSIRKDLNENPLPNRKVPSEYNKILPFQGG